MAIKSKFVYPVAAVSVAFITSVAMSTTVLADENPFSTADLDAGYQLAGDEGEEGSCGEGKCGGDKDKEGSCGESDAEDSGDESDAEDSGDESDAEDSGDESDAEDSGDGNA